jgi:hypothetical protein
MLFLFIVHAVQLCLVVNVSLFDVSFVCFFGFLSLFFSSANGANALRLNSQLLLCTNRRF